MRALRALKGERADLSQAERNALRKELANYAQEYRAAAAASALPSPLVR
jgi:hypothetical protein